MDKNEHTQKPIVDTIPSMSAGSRADRLSILAIDNGGEQTEVSLVTCLYVGDPGSNPGGRHVDEKRGWRRTHGRVGGAVKGVLVLAFPFLI